MSTAGQFVKATLLFLLHSAFIWWSIYKKKNLPSVVERKKVFPFSTYLFYHMQTAHCFITIHQWPPSISCWIFLQQPIFRIERKGRRLLKRPHHYHSIFVVHIYIYENERVFYQTRYCSSIYLCCVVVSPHHPPFLATLNFDHWN